MKNFILKEDFQRRALENYLEKNNIKTDALFVEGIITVEEKDVPTFLNIFEALDFNILYISTDLNGEITKIFLNDDNYIKDAGDKIEAVGVFDNKEDILRFIIRKSERILDYTVVKYDVKIYN